MERIQISKILLVFVTSLMTGAFAAADELYVPGEYTTIQAAIDNSNNGDTIVIEPNVYTGTGNKNLDFSDKAITVRSIDPNDPCVIAATLIDCQDDGRAFYFHSAEDANSVVCGLTITGASDSGIFCSGSSPTILRCIITNNDAYRPWDAYGGGIHCTSNSNPLIINCTISNNRAQGASMMMANGGHGYGGGIYTSSNSYPTIEGCIIRSNTAVGGLSHASMPPWPPNGSAYGGGIFGSATISNCLLIDNVAESPTSGVNSGFWAYGGAIYCSSSSNISNCAIIRNEAVGLAVFGGGIFCNSSSNISNCTIVSNDAVIGSVEPGGMSYGGGVSSMTGGTSIINSIVWNNTASNYPQIALCSVSYSDVEDGYSGTGNINDDPLFADPNNDDYHLVVGSPCIDVGNNSAVASTTDLDGNPRIVGPTVDMGAYEFQGLIYVDDDAPGDPGPGDPNVSDPDENGTQAHPFDTIHEIIDAAKDGHTALVQPGVYTEELDFLGKAITVQSFDEPAILRAETLYAVSFYHQEDSNSILKNFIIRDSEAGILCTGSSPAISNVTVVDCNFGVLADGPANPSITNSIFWDNISGDLFGCVAMYSIVEDDEPGLDPLFADPNAGDYRLKSQRGRYSPGQDLWVLDHVTSPGIDGGDPAFDPCNEPMPNGSRINIGAYGGTSQASMSFNVIVVDDMESYNMTDNPIWNKWVSQPSWGLFVDLGIVPEPVHSGQQSMEYSYDNTDLLGYGYYTEVEYTYDSNQDWTVDGVMVFTLYFYGNPNNDANSSEQMSVGLEDSAGASSYSEVRYGDNDEDMNDIKLAEWQEWNIALSDFSGVTFTDVRKIYLGFGDRLAVEPGGTGTVYFDDLRLYPPRCLPELMKPAGDLNDDCAVNWLDLKILSENWLQIGPNQADVYQDNIVNCKDFAVLAETWPEVQLWPQ